MMFDKKTFPNRKYLIFYSRYAVPNNKQKKINMFEKSPKYNFVFMYIKITVTISNDLKNDLTYLIILSNIKSAFKNGVTVNI